MKKLVLLSLILSIGFLGFSQKRAQISKDLRNISKTAVHVTPTDEVVYAPVSQNPYVSNNKEIVGETTVGTSFYDLWSNSMVGNRIYQYPDGTMAAVWIRGIEEAPAFPDRGTGYNYFDGTSWGDYPTARIEDERTGWPSYAPLGETGEIVAAHLADGLKLSTREQKGTGDWAYQTLNGPTDLTWPRVSTAGDDNMTIHLLANSYVEYEGQTTALFYYRSLDAGTTWDIEAEVIDGMGDDYYTEIGADDYVWADPNGGAIAFLVASAWSDMFIMKSTDNGDSWEKTVIWEHPYPFFNWDVTLTDTFYCVDNSANITLDNDGMAHVVFGINRVLHNVAGTTYNYWPGVDGIGYWNETMPTFSDNINALSPYGDPGSELIEDVSLVGWTQDVNGSGTIDFLPDLMSYRSLGISTMPSVAVDSYGTVFLAYASTTEGYDDGMFNYKHIWVRTKSVEGTWGAFEDLDENVVHMFDECIYPVIGQNITNNSVNILYQADYIPGLALDEDHSYGENRMIVADYYLEGGCNPPEDWTVNPASFAYNGEVTAQIFVDDIVVENGTLAAFVGNECRGVVEAAYFPPGGYYTFTVMCYSNLASGETLSFKYFDPVTCDVCDLAETVDFVADMIEGTPDNPIMLNCGCPLPAGWFVNPPDYAYNGEVTAQVFVDDIAVESGTLAAFVDDECRGVVNATLFPPTGEYIFTVMCYSNLASGEILSFKYFDRVTCEICELDASVDFVADMIEGTPDNPLIFNCGGPITATVDLSAGWTWFSLNIEDEDMSLDNVLSSITLSENDYIKNQTSSATYYAGYGWYGALTDIDPTQMYQIGLASTDILEFTGMAVDQTIPINLYAGWTWIGYLSQVNLDINVALESLSLDENDYIKNQTGSATYYDGYGWYGALETLLPYDGYKISLLNADVLTYPTTTMKSAPQSELPIFANNTGITVNPYKYEFNGTVTARVFNDNELSNSEDDMLLAYVGNECRGISKAMYFEPTDEFAYQLMIYSNIVEGETITFKYFDSQSNELYECIETIQFTNDMIMADAFNALDLNTKSTLGINNTLDYAAFNVYPNPSSGITTIDYTLKTTSEVHIVVSDIYGKQIKEIENKIKDAGSYSTQWNAEINESGTYFIKIVSNNSIQIRKVVLMK